MPIKYQDAPEYYKDKSKERYKTVKETNQNQKERHILLMVRIIKDEKIRKYVRCKLKNLMDDILDSKKLTLYKLIMNIIEDTYEKDELTDELKEIISNDLRQLFK